MGADVCGRKNGASALLLRLGATPKLAERQGGGLRGWKKPHICRNLFFGLSWSLNFDPHPFEHESSRSFAKHGESMFVPLSVECTERPRMILNPYTGFEEMSRICPMVIQKDPQVVCQRDGFKMTPFAAWRCFFAIFWGWVRISCCLIRPRNFKQYVWDSRGRYLQISADAFKKSGPKSSMPGGADLFWHTKNWASDYENVSLQHSVKPPNPAVLLALAPAIFTICPDLVPCSDDGKGSAKKTSGGPQKTPTASTEAEGSGACCLKVKKTGACTGQVAQRHLFWIFWYVPY